MRITFLLLGFLLFCSACSLSSSDKANGENREGFLNPKSQTPQKDHETKTKGKGKGNAKQKGKGVANAKKKNKDKQNAILNKVSEAALIKMGFENYSEINDRYLITNSKNYNIGDESIKVNFVAKHKDGRLPQIDYFYFNLNGKKHQIHCLEYFLHSWDELKKPKIEFIDFNFDGSSDLAMYTSRSGASNLIKEVYLYNSSKNKFELNNDLSGKGNLKVFPEKKVLTSYWHMGGGSYYKEQLSFINNTFEINKLKTLNVNFNSKSRIYISKFDSFANNKIVFTKVDSLIERPKMPNW